MFVSELGPYGEMADAVDLKSTGEIRACSNPAMGIMLS